MLPGIAGDTNQPLPESASRQLLIWECGIQAYFHAAINLGEAGHLQTAAPTSIGLSKLPSGILLLIHHFFSLSSTMPLRLIMVRPGAVSVPLSTRAGRSK
jgi:hypothetical protein